MAEDKPEDVMLSTLTDLDATLRAVLQELATREQADEIIRLLREGIRIHADALAKDRESGPK